MAKLPAMTDLETRYAHYRKRLKDFMRARNLTNEDVGERLGGVHETTISRLRNDKLPLDDEWRARIAEAYGIDHDTLFGYEPLPVPPPGEVKAPRRGRPRMRRLAGHELPVFGWAAGAVAGVETITSDPVDTVPCPPALVNVDGAYALKTRGESMIPRYFPGEILYVDPHKQVHRGDHVIIQTQRFEGGGAQTWIKRYDAADNENIYAAQYNPEGRITFRKDTVLYIHRVLKPEELF